MGILKPDTLMPVTNTHTLELPDSMHTLLPSKVAEYTDKIKEKSAEIYFDDCQIADAALSGSEHHLDSWLDRGFHADMDWITRTREQRNDVQKKLPGVQSVVVVIKNYYSPRPKAPSRSGKISRYAWGRDYHRSLKKPLIRLAKHIESLEPGTRTYSSVDTGPVLERTWAQRAGIAAIGKNSLALRRDIGSWFFIATILTTLKLKPDSKLPDICGTCTACIDACPTQAIVEPYTVDSNRCISYQTIENRGKIPKDLQSLHGDWIYGCDICQEACPWNRFQTDTTDSDFHPRPGHANPDINTLKEMDRAEFESEFEGTPVRRTGHLAIRRNVRIVEENINEST
ncbi:MAG TPA: tRNA epoxyqueuosine(34) reductase QueG [Candidatus Hydrogenedentes bacterium]|nr:tRNA epoxyqueuosine(34) reductase QueG [Candidatus Hydrogenedentota bacterium]